MAWLLKNRFLPTGFLLGWVLWTQPLAAQQAVEAEYDPTRQLWTLANGLIEAEFRLDYQGRFQLVTLGHGNGKQWVEAGRPISSPISLRVDRRVFNENTPWILAGTRVAAAPRGGTLHQIQLRNEFAKAEVTLWLEMYPGQPFLRWYYSFRNQDEQQHFVQQARFFNLRLNTEFRPMTAFYVNQVRQGTPLMFDTFERPLATEPDQEVTVLGGSHADHCTWLAVRDSANQGIILGWEFNGRSRVTAQLRGSQRLEILGAPLDLDVPVGPGEELRLPGGFLGLFDGDWDEAGYRTHRFVETVLAAPLPDDNFPYFVFNTWGYREMIDEATLRRAAQIAAQIGVELFVVDLGWSRQIGEWVEDPVKFPTGLGPFASYVRELGMKFGLHFVPTEAASDSPVLTANPDWTSSDNDEYFNAQSVCLGNRPMQEWLRQTLLGLVRRYTPDWITQDAENLVKRCTKGTHTHYPFNSNWANSVEGIDSLVRFIRARAPRTFWENNADGGTMSTFEAVKYYATFGSCDICEHQERRQSVYGMSYVFPPRFIGRYMEEPPIKFTTRSSMFGGPWILMQRITEWTPAEIQLARQEGALYKSLRGLLREGKVYHLLGPPNGFRIEAIESFHPEWDRGVIFVYRPDSPATSQTILPRGLNPSRNYRVRFQENSDTSVQPGATLMSRGITVRLPSKNFAEIVYITAE